MYNLQGMLLNQLKGFDFLSLVTNHCSGFNVAFVALVCGGVEIQSSSCFDLISGIKG